MWGLVLGAACAGLLRGQQQCIHPAQVAWTTPAEPVTWAYTGVAVKKTAPFTYFSPLAFDGGVVTLQDELNSQHRSLVFSVVDGEAPTEVLDAAWDVEIKRYQFNMGGLDRDGTHLYWPLPWQVDHPVELLLHSDEEDAGRVDGKRVGRVIYTLFAHIPATGWQMLVRTRAHRREATLCSTSLQNFRSFVGPMRDVECRENRTGFFTPVWVRGATGWSFLASGHSECRLWDGKKSCTALPHTEAIGGGLLLTMGGNASNSSAVALEQVPVPPSLAAAEANITAGAGVFAPWSKRPLREAETRNDYECGAVHQKEGWLIKHALEDLALPDPFRPASWTCLPAGHWWWGKEKPADPKAPVEPAHNVSWAYNEITIRHSAPHTYFMGLGFGGGYFGIQEHATRDERYAVFSIWDQGTTVEMADVGPGAHARRFAGELRGIQSIRKFPWKIDEKVQFLVRQQREAGTAKVLYAGYIFDPQAQEWLLMAELRVKPCGAGPQREHGHIAGLYSFIEVFLLTDCHTERTADFGPAFVREGDADWTQLRAGYLSATMDTGLQGNATGGHCRMQVGGDAIDKTSPKGIVVAPDAVSPPKELMMKLRDDTPKQFHDGKIVEPPRQACGTR